MIRHFVFIKYRQDTSAEVKTAIIEDLSRLPSHIDGILDFQNHHNASPEHHVTHGFNDMFWFDFIDESARDSYLENSIHQNIGKRIVENAEGDTKGIYVCDISL